MEVSYGKEPFDLRLMCLRLCRNLWKILAVTVVGTLLFGGGYYVKNVVLQPDPGYAASSTYKVEYKENPNAAGAYYINEATWNTMMPYGRIPGWCGEASAGGCGTGRQWSFGSTVSGQRSVDRRPLGNTSLGFQCSGDTGGNSGSGDEYCSGPCSGGYHV